MAELSPYTDAVDRVYARSLFELAQEHADIDSVAREVEALGAMLAEQPQLKSLFATPAIAEPERAQMVQRLFEGRLSETVYRFLQVLNRKGRLASLDGIVTAFAELIAAYHNIVEVDLWVADRLEEPQLRQVAQALGKTLGKEVALHQYVDPALIGGVKLRIGDKLIDGSVATQLQTLRQQLIDAGREKARNGVGAGEEGAKGPGPMHE